MRRTVCRWAVQNILHDVQVAAESRTLVATSSFAQRRAFLTALHDELKRNSGAILRANRHDCDIFGQQQQQRGTPSVTIPPIMPTAAATPFSRSTAGRSFHSVHGGMEESAFGQTARVSQSAGQRSTAASSATPKCHSASAGAAAAGESIEREFGHHGHHSNESSSCSRDVWKSTAAAVAMTECNPLPSDHPLSARAQQSHSSHIRFTEATAAAPPSPFGSSYPYSTSNGSVVSTEASGGGGHLLLSSGHNLLISPLRLDKLHRTINYLLCQPDPIAVPLSCWLHPHAERGSEEASARQQHCSKQTAQGGPQRTSTPDHGGGPTLQGPYTRRGRCTILTDQLEVFELPVPLGMVGILSRFRPRISLDAVAMGVFAGNNVIVDGGGSLYYTNMALMAVVRRALAAAGLPPSAVVCVEDYDTAHRSTMEWLQLSDYIDLAVVCGPPKLFQFASRHSTIPLMRAAGQFSSVYVDQSASFEVALAVILNSKFQKLGAANAVTTVIIHCGFPRYRELLIALAAHGAVLLGDAAAQERAPDSVLELASEEEYQGLSQYGLRDATHTLCVKTVDSLAQALFFIESYGSKQSDCVVATNPEVCAMYCRQVDTAVALVNASTRLSSGVPLGCGADFAIATSKVHYRGPLTLDMMTTRKLVARSRSAHHGALR